jgi:hypothetical protein
METENMYWYKQIHMSLFGAYSLNILTTTYSAFLQRKDRRFGNLCKAKLLQLNPHCTFAYLHPLLTKFSQYYHCNLFAMPIHQSALQYICHVKTFAISFGSQLFPIKHKLQPSHSIYYANVFARIILMQIAIPLTLQFAILAPSQDWPQIYP